jgi:hypothetical protein
MKMAWLGAVFAATLGTTFGQDVFVLGGPGTTPVPAIVYQPPIVADASAVAYQPVQPVLAVVPVAYATPVYPAATPCASQYYSPNVIYIGSPGTCGPNYYNYQPCSNPNVIYFGRGQAYREGYNFRHCR